jgi:hypothetical protein
MTDKALDELSTLVVTTGQAALMALLAIAFGGGAGAACIALGFSPKLTAGFVVGGAAAGIALASMRKKPVKGIPVVEQLRRDPGAVAHAVVVTKGASAGGGSCCLALVRADGKLLLPVARLGDGKAKQAMELVKVAAPNAKVHSIEDMIGLSTINGLIAKALRNG